MSEYGYATVPTPRTDCTLPLPLPLTLTLKPSDTQLSGAQLAQLLGGARLLEWDRAPEPQLSEGARG